MSEPINNDLFEKSILKVINTGNPTLRQKANPVTNTEIISNDMKRLTAFMHDTMTDYGGVGLAAPQVNIGQQIIIIEYKKEYLKGIRRKKILERGLQEIPFQVLFNPVVTPIGNDKKTFFEGCLSVPGFMGIVERHLSVDVTALDLEGKPITINATGWYARILQHEIDHLNGKLYIDHMLTRSFTTNEHYELLWRHKPIKKIRTELGI